MSSADQRLLHAMGIVSERLVSNRELREAVEFVLGAEEFQQQIEVDETFQKNLRERAPADAAYAAQAYKLGVWGGLRQARNILTDIKALSESRKMVIDRIQASKETGEPTE